MPFSIARWLRHAAFVAGLMIPALACAVDVQIASFLDNPDPAPRGDHITYTITALNNDADIAHNVVVTFALPTNTQFVSAADTVLAGACAFDGGSPGVVTCTYPTLLGTLASPAGPVQTINVVLKTTGATVATLNTVATITTTDADVNLTNNALTQNTTINNGADLSAVLSALPNPAQSAEATSRGR